MSGDLESMGWCCRDVRVQLNNTLNLVTYLQVQLLELMDENQQLKAQLEMCSEVKSPVKLREAPHHFTHFTPRNMNEAAPNLNLKVERRAGIENAKTSRQTAGSSPSAGAVSCQLEKFPPQFGSAHSPGELTHPPLNGDGDGDGERADPNQLNIKVSNVRSLPLKPKLAQPRLLEVRRDLQVPLMEGDFKCDKCPMSFPSAEFLSFHMPTHAGKRKGYHICPVCDAMFVVKSELSKHLAVHPDIKQYVCPVCNKSYTSKNNYKLHVKVHTGEGLYPCSYCGKSFHTENHLNVHLRTHTGERPYECSYCQKSFTQKSGLVNHTRLHTGEKPFVCPLCPKAFTQKSNLNFHLSKHHPPQNAANDNLFLSEDTKFPVNESQFASNDTHFPPTPDNHFTSTEN